MADSREQRSNRNADRSSHLMDAFGVTADAVTLLGDPVTGLLMKGAEAVWRAVDRQIAEEARQKQG
jgi:hypothetical protein